MSRRPPRRKAKPTSKPIAQTYSGEMITINGQPFPREMVTITGLSADNRPASVPVDFTWTSEASFTMSADDAQRFFDAFGGIRSPFERALSAAGSFARFEHPDAPHWVVGEVDATQGVMRLHFLAPPAQPDLDGLLRRLRESVPMWIHLEVTWAWCLKHADCRADEGLAEACYLDGWLERTRAASAPPPQAEVATGP